MNDSPPLASADAVLAAKGRSFHWARRLLGKDHALRATRLYRFCRYIDDVADEDSDTERARAGLQKIRQAIITGTAAHAILIDGLNLISECGIDRAVVLDLVGGVESDTGTVSIDTQEALLRYCYQVAGTVGLMMCQVLGNRHEQAAPYAIDLGIAMQLTNICRDIKTDALLGRRYLPANLINQLAPAALIEPTAAQQLVVRQAVATLLACAERYYQSGEQGLSYLPLRARASILVAARVYREIGQQLKKENYIYWQRRMVVSTPKKLLVTAQALLALTFNRKFRVPPRPHERRLHQALDLRTVQNTNFAVSDVDRT